MQLCSNVTLSEGVVIFTWGELTSAWSVPPALVGAASSPVAGRVFSYTLDGVTRYRLVPTNYTPGEDAFYSSFSNGTLSGQLCTRG
jgi:hypothetical protein